MSSRNSSTGSIGREIEIDDSVIEALKEKRKIMENLMIEMESQRILWTEKEQLTILEHENLVRSILNEKEEIDKKTSECREKQKKFDADHVSLLKKTRAIIIAPSDQKTVKSMQEEIKKAKGYRIKMLRLHDEIRQKQEEKEGVIKSWRRCGICEKEFSKRPRNSPRVLSCGHTFCMACCKRITEDDEIRCPLDRQCTNTPKELVHKLPMNLAVLHM